MVKGNQNAVFRCTRRGISFENTYPIGLLQQTIAWYKIRHAGGKAHYYSPTRTLKQRQVKLDWLRSALF